MNITLQLDPAPLSAEAFKQYGDVIQIEDAHHFSMNGGKLERYYDLAQINVGTETGGRPVMSIASCNQITEFPLNIPFLERHPHGSQAILPLFKQTMIVVVAPVDDSISLDNIRAFYSNGAQGINFHAGVWHFPIIALERDQAFLIVDRGGPNKNCDEFRFNEADEITLLPPTAT
jgi:ureidoglycolate lyase